jgi:hypothetical protein
VQLATAVEVHVRGLPLGLPALTLVSANGELNIAARAEGLMVEEGSEAMERLLRFFQRDRRGHAAGIVEVIL